MFSLLCLMNIQNNNVNFTGLYLKTNNPMALSTKTINKMSQIVKERGGFINRLEKEENADVFISEKLDKVSLSHEKYGTDVHKYMKPIPLKAFTAENEEKIIKTLREAVKKIENDWDICDYLAQMH